VAFLFISYARRDSDFAQKLAGAFTERGRQVWVDSNEIHAGTVWRHTIEDAIDRADAFVAILTPDWLASQQCKTELEHAVDRSKRILPVVRRDLEGSIVPDAIHTIAWVYFRENDDADAAIRELLEAIDRDPDWVREHTLLLERAREWQRQGRDRSLLLRGTALERAQNWLERSTRKASPQPTRLHLEYIVASRRPFQRTRRPRREAVFISYRRDETKGYAGRLHDRLSQTLGEKNVFMDLDSIGPGVDFVAALEEALDVSGALIALIGPHWLTLREPDGRRRLDNPNDFVRLELEGALASGIAVIPLLVDGSKMPRADALPEPLAELARRQALALSHEQWKRDVEALLGALPPEMRRRRGFFRSLRQ
jgi:TIR domain